MMDIVIDQLCRWEGGCDMVINTQQEGYLVGDSVRENQDIGCFGAPAQKRGIGVKRGVGGSRGGRK